MTAINKRSLIALFVSVVLMMSVFTMGAFATETVTITEAASATETVTEAESATQASSETGTTTETATGTTTDTTAVDNSGSKVEGIVNLIILAAIAIVAIIFGIKFRVKLVAFFKTVKTELKKIVWSSKEQTRKNFLVVMVICVAIAVLIGVLDFAFSKGISGLASLFDGL